MPPMEVPMPRSGCKSFIVEALSYSGVAYCNSRSPRPARLAARGRVRPA